VLVVDKDPFQDSTPNTGNHLITDSLLERCMDNVAEIRPISGSASGVIHCQYLATTFHADSNRKAGNPRVIGEKVTDLVRPPSYLRAKEDSLATPFL
jgi:hypothetical protein